MYSKLLKNIFAGILFYSCLPLPFAYQLDFQGVARVAPLVGIIIGGILGLGDTVVNYLGMPVITRSACLVAIWIAITGGLHLDGAMDTADGLAVGDPERRLEVMVDSATGAFGAMAAAVLILLKTVALSDIPDNRIFILVAACGWGRWGQQLAIARYPYLKATGKGAFHKEAIRSLWDVLPGLLLMISFSFLVWLWYKNLFLSIAMTLTGMLIAASCGAWFNYKLGGHTGDTYGAVVEWTEAVFLCVMTIFC
jgi:adenosylcobinamide-GDP ribazoletransferase